MTLEFEKYVERRESVDAVQFTDVSQAVWFAEKLLGRFDKPWEWSLSQRGDSFTLDVGVAKIHCGDYLVRERGIPPRYRVIAYSDFRVAWQKPEGQEVE